MSRSIDSWAKGEADKKDELNGDLDIEPRFCEVASMDRGEDGIFGENACSDYPLNYGIP